MLEAMGFATGVDLDRLVEVRKLVHDALPDVVQYGAIAKAGLPKNFRAAPVAAGGGVAHAGAITRYADLSLAPLAGRGPG